MKKKKNKENTSSLNKTKSAPAHYPLELTEQDEICTGTLPAGTL
jgi:hypothetical protein